MANSVGSMAKKQNQGYYVPLYIQQKRKLLLPCLPGVGSADALTPVASAEVMHPSKSNWPEQEWPGWSGPQPTQCISLCPSGIQIWGCYSLREPGHLILAFWPEERRFAVSLTPRLRFYSLVPGICQQWSLQGIYEWWCLGPEQSAGQTGRYWVL